MIASAGIVNTYLMLNVWMGIGYLVMRFLLGLPVTQNYLTQQWRLKLVRFAFLLLVITPLLAPYMIAWLPFQSSSLFQFKPFSHVYSDFMGSNAIPTFSQPIIEHSISCLNLYEVVIIFVVISMLVAVYQYVKNIWKMQEFIKSSYQHHAIHGIFIMFSTNISIPCCCQFLRRSYVMLPTHLLEKKTDLKLALRHELQHLRQGDTAWLHLFALLKILCFFNPLFTGFVHWFNELHEFACDEALIVRRKVIPETYGQCLLNVATMTLATKNVDYPHFATLQLMNPHSSSILNRRVHMLFRYQKSQSNRFVLGIMSFILMSFVAMTAYATNNTGLNPLSLSELTDLLQASNHHGALHLTATPEVLTEINQIRENPKACEFIRASVKRMATYAPYIRTQLQKQGMPEDLLALPLVESGYQPLPENRVRSAGIWGFIPSTAQHYGLVVNAHQDERFDSTKATQAALAYLSKLHNEFHDWNLAIMAYNQGEKEIHRLLMQTGQSNAWQLIRASDGNAELKKYLPAVHAAIIIMHHPELV